MWCLSEGSLQTAKEQTELAACKTQQAKSISGCVPLWLSDMCSLHTPSVPPPDSDSREKSARQHGRACQQASWQPSAAFRQLTAQRDIVCQQTKCQGRAELGVGPKQPDEMHDLTCEQGSGQCRADPRHQLIRDASRLQRLHLAAHPAEHGWAAAFQADDLLPLPYTALHFGAGDL